jgi:prepilin-type processing-associated H-X9-DG protein
VVLTLAFMALARIKNPEQLKQCKPGEIGRFNNILIDQWYRDDQGGDTGFLYVDGHVRIYYGYKTNLPSKYIAR